MSESLAQCDCCDYFIIQEGNYYEICTVCFWEQDAFGVLKPDEASGANHDLTLHEGRKIFLMFGACAAKFKANVVPFLSTRTTVMLHALSSPTLRSNGPSKTALLPSA